MAKVGDDGSQTGRDAVRARLADIGVLCLVACAILLSVLYLRARSHHESRAIAGPIGNVSGAEWRRYAAGGHRLGADSAPVVITEFSDFSCPFCAQSQRTLRAIVRKYNGRVAVSFHHWPQTSLHPHAFDAAISSECAAEQGAFAAYHDWLFAHQDAIGVQPWGGLAFDAGVRDTSGFSRCMTAGAHTSAIHDDATAAARLGGRGTPFFLVNDRAVVGAVPLAVFEAVVKEKLAALSAPSPSRRR